MSILEQEAAGRKLAKEVAILLSDAFKAQALPAMRLTIDQYKLFAGVEEPDFMTMHWSLLELDRLNITMAHASNNEFGLIDIAMLCADAPHLVEPEFVVRTPEETADAIIAALTACPNGAGQFTVDSLLKFAGATKQVAAHTSATLESLDMKDLFYGAVNKKTLGIVNHAVACEAVPYLNFQAKE